MQPDVTGITAAAAVLLLVLSLSWQTNAQITTEERVDKYGCNVKLTSDLTGQWFRGIRNDVPKTKESCLQFCLDRLDCYGVDFNRDESDSRFFGCWWYDQPQAEVFDGGEFVSHYTVDRYQCPPGVQPTTMGNGAAKIETTNEDMGLTSPNGNAAEPTTANKSIAQIYSCILIGLSVLSGLILSLDTNTLHS